MQKVTVNGREIKVPRRFEKWPKTFVPCVRCQKASDAEIIEALTESKGICLRAAAWLLENKGIKISSSAICGRIKRNPALAEAQVEIIEADKKARPYKPRPRCRKVSDEEVIEALAAGEGVIRKATAWLLENKGIKIDDTSIGVRLRRDPDLARALVEIREKVKAERELRPVRNRLPKKLNLPHGPAPKVPDNVFREALRECYGNHYGMVRYIKNVYGIEIDREYIRLRMDKHPEFRALKKEIREECKDIAESKLHELIEKEDRRAIIYFLRTRAQDRGWGYGVHFERKEAELKAREERIREREETLDACGTKTSLELLLDVLPQEEVTRILKILYSADENGADHPADENLRAVLKKQSKKKGDKNG